MRAIIERQFLTRGGTSGTCKRRGTNTTAPLFECFVSVGPRSPRTVSFCAVLVFLTAAVLAFLLDNDMPAGGYGDPSTESARAEKVLSERFDAAGMPAILLVTGPAGVDSPAARERGRDITRVMAESGYASRVLSYWDLPPGAERDALRSRDGTSALVTARIAGDDGWAPGRIARIAEQVSGTHNGVEVKAGGQAMVYEQLTEQAR